MTPRAHKVVYPSDLSHKQWRIVAHSREACGRSGRFPRRELLNAIFHILKTGMQWWYLPRVTHTGLLCYLCFRRWSHNGVWDKVVEALQVEVRYSQGRSALPTAAVIDTQNVKTTRQSLETRLHDGAKKIKGRRDAL